MKYSKMISFIIIGRNENWKLTRCLDSIIKTIKQNQLKNWEIIYVDSNSTDDSIIRVKKFKNIKIIKLLKDYNAAIARNIGAEFSNGNILFFIDGDMELIPESIRHFISFDSEINYPFLSGDFINNYYYKSDLVQTEKYHNNKIIKKSFTTGGLFIIKKELWDSVGGMRPSFKRGQDLDLGLRLAKEGFLLHRLPEPLAIHNTAHYRLSSRKWIMLFNFSQSYTRSYLYRMNFFNIWTWKQMVRVDYTMIVLFIFLMLSCVLNSITTILFTFYLMLLLIRSFKINFIRPFKLIEDFIYFIMRDIFQLLGFLTFFPKKRFKIDYVILNSQDESAHRF